MIYEIGLKQKQPIRIKADIFNIDSYGRLEIKKKISSPESKTNKYKSIQVFNTNKWEYIKDVTEA